ncbi:MAG: DUF4325 domain-containing protein [Verrucomicrobiota bacterium]
MNNRDKIFQLIKKNHPISGSFLSKKLKISRQALNNHIKKLTEKGLIVKSGVTKNAAYSPATNQISPIENVFYTYKLEGLQEDVIFDKVSLQMNLKSLVSENCFNILNYAFTEMLNNSIDHSLAASCDIHCYLDSYSFKFTIRDKGVGTFHTIAKKYHLNDEYDALSMLLKGKATSQPDHHAGEGIFFTSRIADTFILRSNAIQFEVTHGDVFVRDKAILKGTEVTFVISKQTKRSLERLFSEHAPESYNYQFEKTRVEVHLFQKKYISRSVAKRLSLNLDQFSEVILDFKGVDSIGQGFADELLRVFPKKHKNIKIDCINTSPAVRTMIDHVRS